MAMLVMIGTSFAATINVPDDYATIQDAVNASASGDVILVSPGVYTGTGARVIEVVSKTLTIRSTDGYMNTIIDGEGQRGCLRLNDTATLSLDGFTLQNGYAASSPYPNGGALWLANGDAEISNCAIINNGSGYNYPGGGAIAGWQSWPTFTNCLIANNVTQAGFGGAAAFVGGAQFINCIIRDNSSSANYGAIFSDYGAGYIDASVVCQNSGSWQTYGPSFSNDSILSGTCEPAACGDLDGSDFVDVNDVLVLISSWGESGPGLAPADFDFSGDVGVEDLLYLIQVYGNDCTPLGACCFGFDWCDEFVTEAYCQNNSGKWQGEGSNCGDCY